MMEEEKFVQKKRIKKKKISEEVERKVNVKDEKSANSGPMGKRRKAKRGGNPEKDEAKMNSEMRDLPLSKILELENSLGAKLYKKALWTEEGLKADIQESDDGRSEAEDDYDMDDDSDGDNNNNDEPSTSHAAAAAQSSAFGKVNKFKRENRKRPQEVSSKKRVPKMRNIFKNERIWKDKWDPRFASTGDGQNDDEGFNQEIFDRDYGFISEIKSQEMENLRKKIRKTKDPNEKAKLKQTLKVYDDRQRNKAASTGTKERLRDLRRQNMDRMKEGKNPVYLKRRELKEIEMNEKYAKLKKSGSLDKYLKRKAKKNARKSGFDQPNVHSRDLAYDDDSD